MRRSGQRLRYYGASVLHSVQPPALAGYPHGPGSPSPVSVQCGFGLLSGYLSDADCGVRSMTDCVSGVSQGLRVVCAAASLSLCKSNALDTAQQDRRLQMP